MSNTYEISEIGEVIADKITEATGTNCAFSGVKEIDAPGETVLALQPLATRRAKIDRKGVQVDYAFELYFYSESAANTVEDTLSAVEDYFFHSPKVDGEVNGKEVEVVFQQMNNSSESRIQNGGTLEGYYNTADLEQNQEQVHSALIYFSGWYVVQEETP